ncbi:polysaccharide pyruvyl transferase family protein [Rhizobium sp. CFBP 8762]|uniref:polysaccharide pyruvyl transferase family protein n=1 Tax=Rhizobium sp. CFBP 8762 TaxID=2775279 RepID=UPI00177A8E7E|nr:polysaccharide pyruvyl transferase family protein [Rhizobium sp. CFBP 8762]MBD8555638.1 polysaccharide pyruvyl transferase family protein [Rhizobium sp. CFBP 8762]
MPEDFDATVKMDASGSPEPTTPIIISACAGGRRRDSAKVLAEDCSRFGLKYDFVEWPIGDDETWDDICSRKIQFYRDSLEKHRAPVFWMDATSRIVRKPRFLENAGCDFGAFLHGFTYLNGFDSEQTSRYFASTLIYFGYSEASLNFIDRMLEIQQQDPGLRATDGYFLEEAWRSHSRQLDITIFAPKHVVCVGEDLKPDASIATLFRGNADNRVSRFKRHDVRNLSISRQVHVLKHLTAEARLAKDLGSAKVLAGTTLKLDPSNQNAAIELSKTFTGKEKVEATRDLMQRYEPHWTGELPAKRRWVDIELQQGDLAIARRVCDDLLRSASPLDRGFAESSLYRIGLEERANEQGLTKAQRPKLWWMVSPYPGNFGDVLNPYIVDKLTGLPPAMVPQGTHNLVIGSVIKFAKKGTKVWGTGTPRMTDQLAPDADYRAVRGPRTRQLVLSSGGSVDEVFGDVAAFLPALYFPKIDKTHSVGLIRHTAHQRRPLATNGIKEIEILCVGDEGIERFIRDVLSCERIISTSLHGLIVAHAYGIPAEWATFKDDNIPMVGDGTKFHDYFESIGLEAHEPINFTGFGSLTAAIAKNITRLPERPIDLKRLASVSPFQLKAEYL